MAHLCCFRFQNLAAEPPLAPCDASASGSFSHLWLRFGKAAFGCCLDGSLLPAFLGQVLCRSIRWVQPALASNSAVAKQRCCWCAKSRRCAEALAAQISSVSPTLQTHHCLTVHSMRPVPGGMVLDSNGVSQQPIGSLHAGGHSTLHELHEYNAFTTAAHTS